MTPYQELAELQSQADRMNHSAYDMARQADEARSRHDYAMTQAGQIDPNSYHKKANGMMETSAVYRADTLINIGGASTTVESAIAAGLIPASTLGAPLGDLSKNCQSQPDNTEADSESESFKIDNMREGYSENTASDLQYMNTVLGDDVTEQLSFMAIAGNLPDADIEISRLAQASGMTEREVMQTITDAASEQARQVVRSVELITGTKVDSQELLSFLTSHSLSDADRHALRHSVRTGNGAMLSALANKYMNYKRGI